MELMKKLFHGKGYIDGITIINLEGEILFTAKLNNKLSSQEEPYELVGQKFLDVYENLDPKTSTTIKAMELGLPVYIENQLLKAQGKEEIRITSLSIPIKSGKQIVGAIDLSMQESEEELEQNSERVELSYSSFPVSSSGKLVNRNTAFFTIADIIAVDEKMKKAREYISVVAACDLPVMICGETGTGKEVFARQSTIRAQEGISLLLPRTAPPCRIRFLRVFFLEPPKGLLPGPRKIRAYSNWLTAGRFFWMKSTRCRFISSRSCSVFFRTVTSGAWGQGKQNP